MGKAKAGAPAEKLAQYEALVATKQGVERKGATIPYTSLNGHMYSFLSKEGIAGLRLPVKERETFLEDFDTKLCEQYGRVMKEYVEVPDSLLEDTEALAPYFGLSYDYVASLKPKPTKKMGSAKQ